MAHTYHSKAALRSPPHITLHMPFRWGAKKLERLQNALKSFCAKQSPFEIELEGFSSFSPKVIFIDVVPDQQLDHLQRGVKELMKTELNIFNANFQDRPFHPHVTVAFRDLRKSQFHQAWQYFKTQTFQERVRFDELSLLTHEHSKWIVECNFPFK